VAWSVPIVPATDPSTPAWLQEGVLRYVEWIIAHRFDDIAPLHTIGRLACPVLIVHGRQDETVPFSDAVEIARAAGHANVELLGIEDAGHDSVEKIEQHGVELLDFLTRAGLVGQPPEP